MDIFRIIIVSVVILTPSVTGIHFQLSQNKINLESPQDNFVNLTCSMTVTPVKVATFIKILMESASESGWDQVAVIAETVHASLSPTLPTKVRSIMQVSGRLVTDPATNSELIVSMNASLITCLHAKRYRCVLSYLFGDNFDQRNEEEDITLSATADPSTPYVKTVKNLNTNKVINIINGDKPALRIQQGEQLEIVCNANIGTNLSANIKWKYTSPSGTGMIDYNGYIVNGEALVDNSGGTVTNCTYTRSSTMRYTISDKDAARNSTNPLIFSCYVQSGDIQTPNNPVYTVTIIDQEVSAGNHCGGATHGSIVGGLAFVVILTSLLD